MSQAAKLRTKIRREIDEKLEGLDLQQLRDFADRIKAMKPVDSELVATKPRFKVIRVRHGVNYDVEYRDSLRGAEKLALKYFDGSEFQPREVFVQATSDPSYARSGKHPKWKPVLYLRLWVVKMHKPGTKVCHLEVAAADGPTAAARAEASMGIGWKAVEVGSPK